eukprot:8952416-Prorocentrum_lima.AAC.1
MTSSLVGSEMCIRDRQTAKARQAAMATVTLKNIVTHRQARQQAVTPRSCLLYTSDAADDM